MKTLKNIFGIEESKKTINSFINKLDFNAMLMIKGGDGDGDDEIDLWPRNREKYFFPTGSFQLLPRCRF